jgi:two-component system CheB/CheR fusion protein
MAGTSSKELRSESERLHAEIEDLRIRLDDAEQALEAIRTGQAESLVVEGPNGPRIFSLEGADHSYRVLVEAMNEGAATLGTDGTILYCNARFAEMLGAPIERVMGRAIHPFLPERSRDAFAALVREAEDGEGRGELELLGQDGEVVPAYLSVSTIHEDGNQRLCLVATDLRAQKRNVEIVAAERLARSVIEQAAEAIVVCDEQGRIMRASRAAADLCGGMPLLRMFDEAFPLDLGLTSPDPQNVAAEVLQGTVLRATPATLHAPDGSKIDVLVSATALRGAEAKAIGCVVNLVEITDLSLARQALEESEARFRSVLENSLDAAYRRDLQDDKFDYLSPAIGAVTGFTVDEMLAMSVDEAKSRTHTDDLAGFDAAWREAERTGELLMEYRFQCKDGQYRWLADRAVLVKDENGRFRFRSGVVRDITARKQLETDLRKQATERARMARLYEVLSRVNEAIVRCREEQELHERVCSILVEVGGYPLAWIGQVRGERVVPTAACGPDAEYVGEITVTVAGEYGKGPTGTSIREGRAVVNQDFRAEAVMGPWRERAIRHGFRSSAAFPLRRGDAVVASLTLYAREPAAFDAEHTRLLESLASDVSYFHDAMEDERLRALAEESLAASEAKLREADERKSHFLAVLSHELRNPLAPIKNSLHILNRVAPGGDQAIRAKAVIERQVNQLSRLVDDLLDVTRLTRGKLRLERARLDFVEAIRRTADDHRPLFEAAGIDFDVALPARPLWMHGDAARLAQAIGNLLTNAAKFTPKGGKVVLSIDACAPDVASIRVRDTGVGIPKELLTYLFDPFMQVESTIDRSKGGLGLGLALVKGVVEMHGGSVEPHSEGLGRGAEFVVKLPIDARPIFSVGEDKSPSASSPPRRVLVVEDNVDAALSLKDVMILCGHQVEVAYNGREGIDKARTFKPDVVICDIGLPGIDGYAVAKALRSDENLCSARLIALSGYAQPEDLQRSTAAGFDAHIAKPASIEAIEEALSPLAKGGETHG